jgi:hypothetical protein
MHQKNVKIDSSDDSSSDFSKSSAEVDPKIAEVQKNNQLFVSFYFDANQNKEEKP